MSNDERVCVIGLGYVGLTTALCFASLGHHIIGVDNDSARVALLRAGECDLHEADMPELLDAVLAEGTFVPSVDLRSAVTGARIVVLCLPTPMGAAGDADLSAFRSVLSRIREHLRPGCVVVTKSTVPVGTAVLARALLDRPDVHLAANPEFLREGSAIADFLRPDRILIGADEEWIANQVAALYRGIETQLFITDTASAELAKYTANAFLATKLAYANMIAELCEKTGADAAAVLTAAGADPRIGSAYLRPGPGWGGPCLPKDTAALTVLAARTGTESALLDAVGRVNRHQQSRIVERIATCVVGELSGKVVALLGLTFKARTKDLRDSPALTIAALLHERGAVVTGWDPTVEADLPGIRVHASAYLAARGADVVAVTTDWPEVADLDWQRIAKNMNGDTVVDARALLDAKQMAETGLYWWPSGKPTRHPGNPVTVPEVF